MNSPFGTEPPSLRRAPSWKVALAFSLLPGGGHVYLGYPRRGFLHIASVGALVSLISSNKLGAVEPMFNLVLLFVLLHGFLDAYRLSVLKADLAAFDAPPAGEEPFSANARAALGLMLTAGGLLALLVTRFGINPRWLLEWWPGLFVIGGLVLLIQGLKERP